MRRLMPIRATRELAHRIEVLAYDCKARYYPEPSSTLDRAGQPTPQTNYAVVSCSFTDKVSAEAWQDLADPETVQAELRVSSIIPNKGSKFALLSKWGLDLDAVETFEVAGIKDRGSFGYICALKKVSI